MLTRILISAMIVSGAAAAADAYRLQWRDLDPIVRGRKVSLTLTSGGKLGGRAMRVDPGQLVLETRKGVRTVLRADVERIRVDQTKGCAWRAVGTAVGGAIGAAVAIPLALYLGDSGRMAATTVLGIGVPATLGWLAGWDADRKITEIVVVPGPAVPERPAPKQASWTSYLLAGSPSLY